MSKKKSTKVPGNLVPNFRQAARPSKQTLCTQAHMLSLQKGV